MKRLTVKFLDKQRCGTEYSSKKHMKKTGKEQKKYCNKYGMNQPITDRAVIMMIEIDMRVKKIGIN